MTAAPAAARYLVRGQVQGVGFRWFVRREAQWLGLHGFVRNLPDGSVEVVAAGAPDALTVLEAVLGEGPRSARVSRVEKSDVPHEQTIPNDFQIM